ncbi:hypothetical protein PAEPH01_2343 [Pancytospora epiphaga]|nr:hypothetical protein PAEPH01_2343 [Pancytospora epiphaga]
MSLSSCRLVSSANRYTSFPNSTHPVVFNIIKLSFNRPIYSKAASLPESSQLEMFNSFNFFKPATPSISFLYIIFLLILSLSKSSNLDIFISFSGGNLQFSILRSFSSLSSNISSMSTSFKLLLLTSSVFNIFKSLIPLI